MRIVVTGRGAESPTSSVRTTVVAGLEHAGHETVGFDPQRHGSDPPTRTRALGGLLAAGDVDLVLVIPTPGDLDLHALRAVAREHDVFTLAWHTGATFSGAPTRPDELPETAVCFDAVAVTDDEVARRVRPWVRHGLVTMAPAVHPAGLDLNHIGALSTDDLVVVGDADPHNAALVRELVDVGLRPALLGRGWSEVADLRGMHRVDAPAERVERLRRARLVVELPPTHRDLSLAGLPFAESGLTQSALDAAALGTAVVTLDRPAVALQLTPGEEILVAESTGDLGTLARLTLSAPEYLDEIGLAAQTRLRAGHRWDQRWTELMAHFDVDHVPASRAATHDGVGVIVPVAADDAPSSVERLLRSVLDQGVAGVDLVVVVPTAAHVPGALSEDPLVEVVVDDHVGDAAVLAGLLRTRAELVTVARPGEVWADGRLAEQLGFLQTHPAVDAVHGSVGDQDPAVYDRWSFVRCVLTARAVAPGTVLARRRVLDDHAAAPGLLGGQPEAVAASSGVRWAATGPALIELRPGDAVELPADLFPLLDPSPSVGSTDDRALAASLCGWASDLARAGSPEALNAVGATLDHVDDAPPALLSMWRGGAVDTDALDEVVLHLSDGLAVVEPSAADRCWTSTGEVVVAHRPGVRTA